MHNLIKVQLIKNVFGNGNYLDANHAKYFPAYIAIDAIELIQFAAVSIKGTEKTVSKIRTKSGEEILTEEGPVEILMRMNERLKG